jgi:hypothetical protein
VTTLTFRFGALTVAAMELDVGPLGVVKPAGVVMTKLTVPAATGWKTTLVTFESGLMVTGLARIVPMVVSELVIVTLTLSPARRFWLVCAVSVAGLSWYEAIDKVLSVENVVVEKLPEFHSIAEGVSATAKVPLLYPGAEAVSCALPVLAKPCIEKAGTEKLPAVRGRVMD